MAGAKALTVWLVLAILASNPLQAVGKTCNIRRCIAPCNRTCCIKNEPAPCTFYASPLGQTITINIACMEASDPRVAPTALAWWGMSEDDVATIAREMNDVAAVSGGAAERALLGDGGGGADAAAAPPALGEGARRGWLARLKSGGGG
ncbi:hypothetical protein Rsub_09872 [Raphidocelis subcapitata]|uniref:Uncharacterized protein n=1 Tax=Raphidocelis subcapitata TaxID=307507 RepID=A0A2V0PHX1_9CHLO|nr:hypothetical protein Rsub_09872 [Raphidocelis subcapitata]|eukprot:GBF96867.1 hypothetical protein Rsub_09872 [Raphidocelis subcapitata]